MVLNDKTLPGPRPDGCRDRLCSRGIGDVLAALLAELGARLKPAALTVARERQRWGIRINANDAQRRELVRHSHRDDPDADAHVEERRARRRKTLGEPSI